MYAPLIPIAGIIAVGIHTESKISAIRKKCDTLYQRNRAIQSIYARINAGIIWNADTFASLTTKALGFEFVKPFAELPFSPWESTVLMYQAAFDNKIGQKSIQKISGYSFTVSLIANIAQVVICIRQPLPNLVRIVCLVITAALPVIFYNRLEDAIVRHKYSLSLVDLFAHSYPKTNKETFNQFVWNGQLYGSSSNLDFSMKEMNAISSGLLQNEFPENVLL